MPMILISVHERVLRSNHASFRAASHRAVSSLESPDRVQLLNAVWLDMGGPEKSTFCRMLARELLWQPSAAAGVILMRSDHGTEAKYPAVGSRQLSHFAAGYARFSSR